MKTTLKQIMAAGLVMLGIGFLNKTAQAASTDTIQLSVTPGNITYGVVISSPYVGGYNFGTVNLTQTTVSTLAITVTATGANVSEFFGLAVSNTSGSWAPASAPGTDAFRMIGYFNATQPSSTTFNSATDYLTTTLGGAASGHYNESAKTAPGGSASLWLRLDMPTALNAGGTGAQTMTLTVTGQSN